MEKVNCINCGTEIPEARLKALPETNVCVKCSNVKKVKGFNVIEHKTGNWVQVINQETYEELAKLDNDKGRGRTGYAGAS